MTRRIISAVLLACMLVALVPLWGGVFAVETPSESAAASPLEAEGKSVSFRAEYPELNVPLEVTVTGLSGNLTYEWKVDDVVKGSGPSYTPVQADLEKFIQVTVSDGTDSLSTRAFFSRLPVIYIDTDGGKPVESKENYIDAQIAIQGNADYNRQTTTLYSGTTKIRGRGNTTWTLPKKPYKLKLDKSTDLFGFGKSKHWVLLANYYDTTYLRNYLSYNLSGDLGMPYMQSVLTDVVMNGQYVGNYQLCEQIRISSGRVDILNWEDEAETAADKIATAVGLDKTDADTLATQMTENLSWVTSDQVSLNGKTYQVSQYYTIPPLDGGYLLELDSYLDEYSTFETNKTQPIMFNTPEYAATNPEMMAYVKEYIQAFEDAAYADNYAVTYKGQELHYTELFDLDSLIDSWLVNEIFFNVDFMKKSTYMYKDTDGLFKMGPIWDMDWTSGAYQLTPDKRVSNVWQTLFCNYDVRQQYQWYRELIHDPYFVKAVQNRYWEVRDGAIQDMLDSIAPMAAYLSESAEASLKAWKQGGYTQPVKDFTDWMTARIAFLDGKMASFENLSEDFLTQTGTLTITLADGTALGRDTLSDPRAAYEKMAPDGAALKAEATVPTSAVTAELWVNSKKIATQQVTNGKAAFDLEPLAADSVIQVFAFDKSGKLAGTAYQTVKRNAAASLVVTLPSKTTYFVGETFDPAGMQVSVVYADGSREEAKDYTVSAMEATVGKQTLTVTCRGLTATFEVEVVRPVLQSLRLKTLPEKRTYELGEAFDPKGLVVEAVYTDGSSREVTGYTLSALPGEVGKHTITVTYTENDVTVTATFEVEVVRPVLQSLRLKTLPEKRTYELGETFAPKGLVVEAVYTDGSSREVTGYTLSALPGEVGKHTITVTYTEDNVTVTATFEVEVVPVPETTGEAPAQPDQPPKTGDPMPVWLLLLTLAAAGSGLTACVIQKKKF